MSLQVPDRSDLRHDGFGSRYGTRDAHFGPVEVIDVCSALGTPAAEQAIRTAAARLSDTNAPILRRIVRIARAGGTLSITSIAADGVTLSDLLAALEFGTLTLGDEAVLALARASIAAVAAMHAMPGAPVHGALNPSHVVVRADGSVVLTGAVFGDALQALQFNREQLWRIFGVALPPSASLPRFDQRADVTQLGTLVLAILLRRALTAAEYPRQALDLIDDSTETLAVTPRCRSALRTWLQQTLQLQAKALFGSAVDASRAFADATADLDVRRGAVHQLQSAIAQLSPSPAVHDEIVAPPRARPMPQPVSPPTVQAAPLPAPSRGAFLRAVFPVLRAN